MLGQLIGYLFGPAILIIIIPLLIIGMFSKKGRGEVSEFCKYFAFSVFTAIAFIGLVFYGLAKILFKI